MVHKKGKEGKFIPELQVTASVFQWQMGSCCQRLLILTVGRDIIMAVNGGVAIQLEIIKNQLWKRYIKRGRRGNSYLCSQSLLLLSVVDGALVSAPPDCDCGLRYHHGHG